MPLPIEIIRQLIVNELNIDDSRVIIYNQEFFLPSDNSLFIALEAPVGQVYSSRIEYELNESSEYEEIKHVNAIESINVIFMSRNNEAFIRRYELIAALNSTYSKELQQQNDFKIFSISDPQDASSVEEPARLMRFDIEIKVDSSYQFKKQVSYYDTLQNVELTTEDSTETITP